MLAMDVWCFSKSTARIDLEKHQTRLHYWGISFCNFGESPLQFWVFLLYTKQMDSDEVLRYIYEYGYTAEQIASAMSTDINLVALKVAHLATLGYNLHALEHKSNFLK